MWRVAQKRNSDTFCALTGRKYTDWAECNVTISALVFQQDAASLAHIGPPFPSSEKEKIEDSDNSISVYENLVQVVTTERAAIRKKLLSQGLICLGSRRTAPANGCPLRGTVAGSEIRLARF